MDSFNNRYANQHDVSRRTYLRGLQQDEEEDWNSKTGQDSLESRFGSLQSSESRVLREDRPLMNQCKIPQEVNNGICEAAGCFLAAEVQLKVKVGQQGTITLSLCKNCVSKFEDVDQSGG